MIKRFLLAIAGVCLLVATGCVQGDPLPGQPNIRAVLASACPAWADAEAIYDAIAAEGVLSQSTLNYGAITKKSADMLCANRENATVISITVTGIRIYKMVDMAVAEAKRSGLSVGYAGELKRLEGVMSKLKKGLDRAR